MKKLFVSFALCFCAFASGAQASSQPVAAPQETTAAPSLSLPVLYINTEGGAPIVSKEDYINATYYVDNAGLADCPALGSATAPLAMEIRGRGNYTWIGFDKKPYRIKLADKQELLGMKKSRHFALLAHADDDMAFLRNTVGFELSRRLGLAWTPDQKPVEVVLNGDYIGLYFLTETIRVDKDRVNIIEQPDSVTDPVKITGGWLVEIDNYDEDLQVRITEGNGEVLRFTYKTPELLSTEQENYLRTQMTTIDAAIYSADKQSAEWEQSVDIDTLARFYVVQEILDDAESFHGSCYLHKEQGDAKWVFGPVWDFGNSYRRSGQEYIYVNPPYGQSWIHEIAKFPHFQQKVKEVWLEFTRSQHEGLDSFIDDFINEIDLASQSSHARWKQYGNADVQKGKQQFIGMLNNRIDWLSEQWGSAQGVGDMEQQTGVWVYDNGAGFTVLAQEPLSAVSVYDVTGTLVAHISGNATRFDIPCQAGIYLLHITDRQGETYQQKALVR